MESVDLVIVGAGWHGLSALKTYRQVHPTARIICLDSASSVGGVWATQRLYPGLKSNNMLGTYEFSDFPMDASFGVKPGEHIPGEVIHEYLARFVERVEAVDGNGNGGWVVTTAPAPSTTFTTSTKCTEYTLLTPSRKLTILGGTKSAWDAVHAACSASCTVTWIIRRRGHGPAWMAPPHVTPFKAWLEKLVTTRLLTWFSPCIWGEADGFGVIRRFLHGTWLGRKVVDGFWGVLERDVVALNGYEEDEEVGKLRPWGVLGMVRSGRVRVIVDDIRVESEGIVCATGWAATPRVQFRPAGIERALGFPWAEDFLSQGTVRRADAEILRRFPKLREARAVVEKRRLAGYVPLASDAAACARHPYRLARFMVPAGFVGDRSVVVLGNAMTINTALVAQTQALWAAAYLGGDQGVVRRVVERCPLDLVEEVRGKSNGDGDGHVDALWEMALHTQFGVHRCPGGFGKRNPDFVFDALPYVDLLLRDLGLDVKRKTGWCWMKSYGMEDYRGLVEEWLGRE
ncbi:FAD/NAD(P)-binding domain-containing protein [Aspergillus heteromorphus CBS 117.55]|uniref:FAD/NAD(P)-binding domain-containing protein n=1 Tax=Aspergillus heteromorphus CBS 117.55 TaxID=1448321 RepID=A0A317WAL0_9EURO|nr:FAD/NAD(P)-binding domain-containing protein [Aspergillus heteromorphus CBS 117.55]PWY83556.1 FAD/NAD(P)-binding domain-containing protein [Aspergillus heteromorphus CBS 117.55]